MGITEKYEESIVKLNFKLGINLDYDASSIKNKSPKHFRDKISEEDYEHIKSHCKIDLKLYKMALEKFESYPIK